MAKETGLYGEGNDSDLEDYFGVEPETSLPMGKCNPKKKEEIEEIIE